MDFNDLMATPTILLHRSLIYYFFFFSLLHLIRTRGGSSSSASRKDGARNRAAGFTFDLDEMELLIRSSRFRYEPDDV